MLGKSSVLDSLVTGHEEPRESGIRKKMNIVVSILSHV